MFCRNCGKEINKTDNFCNQCGASTGNNIELVNQNKKGKGIASMVLGILAIMYTLSAFSLVTEIKMEYLLNSTSNFIGSLIGLFIIELTLAIISISLSISERKKHKNGFNTSGLWLSISAFILMIILLLIIIFSL